jgi:hypothetical protein
MFATRTIPPTMVAIFIEQSSIVILNLGLRTSNAAC